MGNEELIRSVNQRYQELLEEHKSEFLGVLTDVAGCVERLTMAGVLTEEERNRIIAQITREDEKEVLASLLGEKSFVLIKFVMGALGDEKNLAAQEILRLIIRTICDEIPGFDQKLMKEPDIKRKTFNYPVLPPSTETSTNDVANPVDGLVPVIPTASTDKDEYFVFPSQKVQVASNITSRTDPVSNDTKCDQILYVIPNLPTPAVGHTGEKSSQRNPSVKVHNDNPSVTPISPPTNNTSGGCCSIC